MSEFWGYTLYEINQYLEAMKKKKDEEEKNKLVSIYLSSTLTAQFVARVVSGKSIPSIYDTFPHFIEKPPVDWEAYEAQFRNFAEQYNQKER